MYILPKVNLINMYKIPVKMKILYVNMFVIMNEQIKIYEKKQ